MSEEWEPKPSIMPSRGGLTFSIALSILMWWIIFSNTEFLDKLIMVSLILSIGFSLGVAEYEVNNKSHIL